MYYSVISKWTFHTILNICFIFLICFGLTAYAQQNQTTKTLRVIEINGSANIHMVSPENIQYADISSHAIIGDFPVKKLLRIKISADSLKKIQHLATKDLGVMTIVGESYIAQYRLRYVPVSLDKPLQSKIDIMPEDTAPLDVPEISLSSAELKAHCFTLLNKPLSASLRKEANYGIQARLNQVYALGDHVFLDLSFLNQTNLSYTIDELRFKIEDKKITKATNAQSIEVKPIWQSNSATGFRKSYRNIIVLKKLTYPENKILHIELTEKQISGRTITLKVRYSDILKADTF